MSRKAAVVRNDLVGFCRSRGIEVRRQNDRVPTPSRSSTRPLRRCREGPKSASSNISRPSSAQTAEPGRSCAWSVLRASARPRSQGRARSAKNRPDLRGRLARRRTHDEAEIRVTGAHISARLPGNIIQLIAHGQDLESTVFCSTRAHKWVPTSAAKSRRALLECSTPSRTTNVQRPLPRVLLRSASIVMFITSEHAQYPPPAVTAMEIIPSGRYTEDDKCWDRAQST